MATLKCKMCGGDLQIAEGMTVAECEYCGTKQTVPNADNEKKLTLFGRANRLRMACDFDKAAGVYESIVAEFPEEAEAYWGLVLCKYGIEYVDDPATGKKIPTCHRSSFDSVMDDTNLEQALENADAVARKIYREEAKAMEELRKGIIEVSGKEDPYDIFICYKETAENGDRTLDSVIAQDVYGALTEKGYRVFFSRITLEDKLGQEYEPYIFAALHSAKIMLAFGTDYEHYNAVWVKNEWSRFLQLIAAGEKKTLIPCFKGIDAYDLPKEFARLQAQDMGKVGAVQDLLRGIEKILPREKTVTKETVVVQHGQNNAAGSLLKRGYMALEDEEWRKADEFFEQVLNLDAESGSAYLGKFLVQKSASSLNIFLQKTLNATQNADAQPNIADDANTELERAIVEKYSLENYLPAAEIRSRMLYDFTYDSIAASRQEQLSQIKAQLLGDKLYSRAKKFADISVNQQLDSFEQELFSALEQRIATAEKQEQQQISNIIAGYTAHLAAVETELSALRRQAEKRREEDYQNWERVAQTGDDTNALKDALAGFLRLNGYRDSEKLGELCKKQIDAIQKTEATEQERQRAVEAKLAARKKARKKLITIVASLSMVLIVTAVAVVMLVVIPTNKYNTAKELLNAEQYNEAAIKFEALGDYKDSAEQALAARTLGKTARNVMLKEGGFEFSEDGYPLLGRFEQDATPGKDPIEWIPLDMAGDKVLLISRYALDCYSNSADTNYISWDSSLVRKWLNEDFLNTAFAKGEQSAVLETLNITQEISGVEGDKLQLAATSVEATDKVFLLSMPEVISYFGSNPDRYTKATDYAKSKGAYVHENGNTWWMLRTLGSHSEFVGAESGFGASAGTAIRPAMWVSISRLHEAHEEYHIKRQEYLDVGQYTEYVLYCLEQGLEPDYTDVVIPSEEYDAIFDAVASTFDVAETDIRDFDLYYAEMEPYFSALPEDYAGMKNIRILSECMSKYNMGDAYKNTVELFEAELSTLKSLWETEVIRNMLLADDNICEYMLGDWTDSHGNYIQFYANEDGSISTSYNLPWPDVANVKYYDIVNCEYIYEDDNSQKVANVYKFDFTGADTIKVYCYEDGKTYKLTRER